MLAIFTVFAGQFAVFTYTRPFLEQVSGFGVSGVSSILLIFGIANFVGTSLSSIALRTSLKTTLALAPLVLALCAVGLAFAGIDQWAVAVLFAVWGFAFGMVPVGWSTWVTRNLGDDAENAGGLQVAIIQLANTVGAAAGGLVFDATGATGPIVAGGLLLAATSLLVWMSVPGQRSQAIATA
jgi:DHA1 family purine ribonucleoside efflux pump-like MFS transporter